MTKNERTEKLNALCAEWTATIDARDEACTEWNRIGKEASAWAAEAAKQLKQMRFTEATMTLQRAAQLSEEGKRIQAIYWGHMKKIEELKKEIVDAACEE